MSEEQLRRQIEQSKKMLAFRKELNEIVSSLHAHDNELHQLRLQFAQLTDDLKTLVAHRFDESVSEQPAEKPKRKRKSDSQTISFRRDASGRVTHADVKEHE